MAITFDDIKRQLRQLSVEELLELLSLANSLLVDKPMRDTPMSLQLSYHAFVQPLLMKGLIVPPWATLKRDMRSEVYQVLTTLTDWLTGVLGTMIPRNELQPWFFLFGELLVKFLEDRKVPLSLQAVLRQHKSVPGLVDEAFPGYIPHGGLYLVRQAMRKQNQSLDDDDVF